MTLAEAAPRTNHPCKLREQGEAGGGRRHLRAGARADQWLVGGDRLMRGQMPRGPGVEFGGDASDGQAAGYTHCWRG